MEPILFVASAKHAESLTFYRDVMGFALTEDTPFALAFDADGTMLRVQKVEDHAPYPFTAIGWRVHEIEAAIDRLSARGVEFVFYPHLEQDQRGVWTTPDGTRVCWFHDPDGNTLSLSEFSD